MKAIIFLHCLNNQKLIKNKGILKAITFVGEETLSLFLICDTIKVFPCHVPEPWLRGRPGGHASPFSGLGAQSALSGLAIQPVLNVEDLIINTKPQEYLPFEHQFLGCLV